MADTLLRELEREWKATADPIVGLRLILALFRSGLAVDLDSFPLELWHRIASDFSIENISHHLSLGGERLDRQLSSWQRNIANSLPQLGTINTHPSLMHLLDNSFSRDNLLIISNAAAHQTCKTSIVYYPTLPRDRRIAMYINMILSPQTLSEANMLAMQEDAEEGTTYWGLVMKAFFAPASTSYPLHLDMAVLLDASPFEPDPQNWVVKVLNGVSTIYDHPEEPPPDNLGYRVPFLVLKELS